jgi:hypothetical protein
MLHGTFDAIPNGNQCVLRGICIKDTYEMRGRGLERRALIKEPWTS